MKPGRNAPCPCGSGKKYKKCCAKIHSAPHANQPPDASQPEIARQKPSHLESEVETQFKQYLRAFRDYSPDLVAHDKVPSLGTFDSLYTALTWDSYSTIARELVESVELMLLPSVAPDLLQQALDIDRISGSLKPLLRRVANIPDYDRFTASLVNLYETELKDAISRSDNTFNPPPKGQFPIVFKRMLPGEPAYAPQCVSDYLVFSPTLKRSVYIPVLHHSRASNSEFAATASFVHELVHVLQRVFRKHRVPAYTYFDDAHWKVRNPQAYVQIGIEDELEVQRILVAAGYDFSLRPILHHRTNLAQAFRDVEREEAIRYMRSGIAAIDFRKYERLYVGDLRNEIMRACVDAV